MTGININVDMVNIDNIVESINKHIGLTEEPSKYSIKVKGLTMVEFIGKEPLELYVDIELYSLSKVFITKFKLDIPYENLVGMVNNGLKEQYNMQQSIKNPNVFETTSTEPLQPLIEELTGIGFNLNGKTLTGYDLATKKPVQNIFIFK